MLMTFVSENLVNKFKPFFNQIKKVQLHNGFQKTSTLKTESLLREDQAFRAVITKSHSHLEGFRYPITTVPLSVATINSTLRQSDKAALRNYLITESESVSEVTPKNCSWFIDGLPAIRATEPKTTFSDWIKSLLQSITPPEESEATQVGMINDTYRVESVKGGTRRERGKLGIRVKIDTFNQQLPLGNEWQEFLNGRANKKDLIQLITNYLRTKEGKSLLILPHIITHGEKTHLIEKGKVKLLHKCNHEEADTRLLLHAWLADNDVVVVSKDTDVLVLLIWAYEKGNIQKKWYLKYDQDKFADISVICSYLGSKLCLTLPALHAMTGCDTTSYPYMVGKVKVLKKLLAAQSSADLLMNLGEDKHFSQETLENAKEFLRTILYKGKQDETYVETRSRLYKEMNVRSSLNIPPDPDSVVQVMKRVHYQVYIWRRCTEISIDPIPFKDYGWKWCEKEGLVVPVWFTGNQLPPDYKTDTMRSVDIDQ